MVKEITNAVRLNPVPAFLLAATMPLQPGWSVKRSVSQDLKPARNKNTRAKTQRIHLSTHRVGSDYSLPARGYVARNLNKKREFSHLVPANYLLPT